jgi:hypothetical protein
MLWSLTPIDPRTLTTIRAFEFWYHNNAADMAYPDTAVALAHAGRVAAMVQEAPYRI